MEQKHSIYHFALQQNLFSIFKRKELWEENFWKIINISVFFISVFIFHFRENERKFFLYLTFCQIEYFTSISVRCDMHNTSEKIIIKFAWKLSFGLMNFHKRTPWHKNVKLRDKYKPTLCVICTSSHVGVTNIIILKCSVASSLSTSNYVFYKLIRMERKYHY